jgi:hypothetical protein
MNRTWRLIVTDEMSGGSTAALPVACLCCLLVAVGGCLMLPGAARCCLVLRRLRIAAASFHVAASRALKPDAPCMTCDI